MMNKLSCRYLTVVFFAVLVAGLYTFSVVMQVSFVNESNCDFTVHAKFAEDMLQGKKMLPHFFYQLLLIGIHSLFRVSFIYASFITVFLIVFVTFIAVYKNFDGSTAAENQPFLVLATCFLLLSHPVIIFFLYDKHSYFGYIVSNVYHNPTILLLKAIALLHFVVLCNLLTTIKNGLHFYANLFLLGLLTALTLIAKPVYIINLLPALFILFMLKLVFKGEVTHWLLVIVLGVGFPAFLILFWQYNFFYGSENSNSIGVGFFNFFLLFSKLWTLVPKLVVSMAFPISVIITMGSQITRKLEFQLSALILIISLIYAYFLVDHVAGSSIDHGNFWWSSQIAHFLLLFVCIKSYLEFIFNMRLKDVIQATEKVYFPVYIGMLQFISGLAWYTVNTAPAFGFSNLW